MAQYKFPQDVEADDKLLGPFTFRQFVYLMIIGGLVAIGFLLWQIFPLLIIILIPPILLLGALALPFKKDQPMETYLSAIVSYHLKPHTRIWEPGEPEATIVITAPKRKLLIVCLSLPISSIRKVMLLKAVSKRKSTLRQMPQKISSKWRKLPPLIRHYNPMLLHVMTS